MNKKYFYEPPKIEAIELENELFFCTSVSPNPGGSNEKDYDPDEDIDGGEYEFE